MNKRSYFSLALLLVVVLFISGCGETVRGVGRDVSRMGRGVRTIFVAGT